MTAKQLTHRYVLALSLVAMLAMCLLGLAQFSAQLADNDARLINEAGRQRMLSQRLALLAIDPGFSGTAREEEFETAVATFEASHQNLQLAAALHSQLDTMYQAGPDALARRVDEFISLARAVQDSGFAPSDVTALLSASHAILPDLDAATGAFERIASDRVAYFTRLEWVAFIVTIMTLVAEAVLIFRPAVRAIDRTFRALSSARETADRANAAKTEFLAQMSHEIRTPLNGVLGMTTALRDSDLTAPQRKMVNTISASGDLLLSVVNDVLDLSKIESGELELEALPVSLEQLLDWTVSAFRSACEEKGLTLQTSLERDTGDWFLGDPTRMRQILSNLVSNAIKFTTEGSVSVSIRASGSGARQRIELCVADTGIGIAPDKLKAIFDPFSQADTSTTRSYGGTGLGLPICRRLTEMMDGSISVSSRVGYGSTFSAVIQLQSTAPPVEAEPASEPTSTDRPLTILIVDDVATNRLVLNTMLTKQNVTVIQAASGLEAVTTMEGRTDIDAIFMDVQMPGMDGMEAARRIRQLEAGRAQSETPIIAVTANVLTSQIADYREAGMKHHIAKPIDPRRLSGALETLRRGEPKRQAS